VPPYKEWNNGGFISMCLRIKSNNGGFISMCLRIKSNNGGFVSMCLRIKSGMSDSRNNLIKVSATFQTL